MAFKLQQDNTVEWPVTISVPVDGGKIQKQRCSAVFDLLDQADYDELITEGDAAFLSRVVIEFGDDIQDEHGEPLACNDENKRKLFSGPAYLRVGFITAYHQAFSGVVEKNLKTRPGTGQPARKHRRRK